MTRLQRGHWLGEVPAISEAGDRLTEVHATRQLQAARCDSLVDTEERQLSLTQEGGQSTHTRSR